MQILGLDKSGTPRHWMTPQEAVEAIAKEHVVWSLGDPIVVFRGGWNKDGIRSVISTPPIIAVRGIDFAKQRKHQRVILNNTSLFSRDMNMCAYCGEVFPNKRKLSRDHIVPTSRGGVNSWTNCVTACIPCNTRKDNRHPNECGMTLRYIPYEPNHHEQLILRNRHILKDQMEYLLRGVPATSRVHDLAKKLH